MSCCLALLDSVLSREMVVLNRHRHDGYDLPATGVIRTQMIACSEDMDEDEHSST